MKGYMLGKNTTNQNFSLLFLARVRVLFAFPRVTRLPAEHREKSHRSEIRTSTFGTFRQ